MFAIEDFPRSVWSDFVHLFCGERLGHGIGRQVYELATDPTKVVKIEYAKKSFQNAIEWQTWDSLRWTKYGRWLAPCHFISPCGVVLIQERTKPLDDPPPRMPSFLSDFKRDNYGILDGRVVCRDYGTNLLLNHGAFGSRMRKVAWC